MIDSKIANLWSMFKRRLIVAGGYPS